MTPVTQRKVIYATSLVALAAVSIGVVVVLSGGQLRPVFTLFAVAVLVIPGRVNGRLWRDLYRGRRLLGSEEYAGAVQANDAFLAALDRRPALRAARWLVGMIHTREPAAMALNNRAVAHLGLGDAAAALTDLDAALELDPTYALAMANKGGIAGQLGDDATATACRRRAVALGLTEDGVERAMQFVAGLLAEVEGR